MFVYEDSIGNSESKGNTVLGNKVFGHENNFSRN